MNDKPEAVAWMYSKPGCAEEWFTDPWPELIERGWTETTLYAHRPAQDASALVEAVRQSQKVFAKYAEMHRRKLSKTRTSEHRQILAKIERNRAMSDICLAALSAWEQANG
ncbi:hypothetical protein C7451_106167 [Blastomonas natatoria]|uniref:Uncharacterized protein n=1 Tax=Blastomonas natatoria TaxID=34015 RepID=A0A2V3V2N1_9SPHN|nr:hypothetical protein [Blastomonas natatoria]PXW76003.1 hypothetical protein C7451_106167 [Blastomonas natatoria]